MNYAQQVLTKNILHPFPKYNAKYPQTRYQESKQKLIEWIGECISPLEFNSVLDAFGGTGVVSHYMKLILLY